MQWMIDLRVGGAIEPAGGIRADRHRCGGQSNTSTGMNRREDRSIRSGPGDVAKADVPFLHAFRACSGPGGRIADSISGGKWSVCTPETAARISAPAFCLAHDIHQRAECPVGHILHASGAARGSGRP